MVAAEDDSRRQPPDDPETAGSVGATLDSVADAGRALARLLRAELRLARSSAAALVWLGLATLVLAMGAWAGLNVFLIAAIHAWSGSVLLGTGVVACANFAGALWSVAAMRRCLDDLRFPRTRRVLDRGMTLPRPGGIRTSC
jgi:hypothetical protein